LSLDCSLYCWASYLHEPHATRDGTSYPPGVKIGGKLVDRLGSMLGYAGQ
jgi:hypothetical protein